MKLAQPCKQSLPLAVQFNTKFSYVERTRPAALAAGKARLAWSTLPWAWKSLETSEVQGFAPTSVKSP